MDPPVTVIGRRTIKGRTFLAVPGTEKVILYQEKSTRCMSNRLAPIEFKSIVLPLSHVRLVLDLELDAWENGTLLAYMATSYPWSTYVDALKAWRADLECRRSKALSVLRNVRQTFAAKRILNQFRKAIGNPAYRMCQKRLLCEFEDLNR